MKFHQYTLFFLVSIFVSIQVNGNDKENSSAQIIYVKASTSNQENGNQWNSAFNNINSAIEEARNLLTNNSEVQIWIQKGSYTISETNLPIGIQIYGGFNGTEVDISERTNYLTTLDNATIISPKNTNESVFILDAVSSITINGLIFNNLNETSGSSSMIKVMNNSSNINIEHCLFDNNKNDSGGAGLSIYNSEVSISYTQFSNNSVVGSNNSGGAVLLNTANTVFFACTFNRNSSLLGHGGAIAVSGNNTSTAFKYCNLIANNADKGASAVFIHDASGNVDFLNTVTSFNRIEQENSTEFGAFHASGNTNGLTVNLENSYTVFTDNWKKTGNTYQFSNSISSDNATINYINNPIIDVKKSSNSEASTYFDTKDKKETRQMLIKPSMTEGNPTKGTHKKVQFSEYAGTTVYHTIYLPEHWESSKKYPVIVDIPGNPFNHQWGDYSTGNPESSYFGYAITNANAIAVTLPIINTNNTAHTTQLGDVQKTVAYIKKVVTSIIENYNGDAAKIILGGYSRGGLGTSFLGKYDDEIADIWLGWLHYDGYDFPYGPTIDLREFTYNVEDDDWEVSGGIARRFARTNDRSTLIAGSGYANAFQDYNVNFNFPIENFGTSSNGRNHNIIWASGDNSISKQAREWYEKTTTELTGTVTFSGKIISLTSGLPLENVKIEGGITRWDVTNLEGEFSFEGLPKGTRSFNITLPNNLIITKELTINSDVNQDIYICDGDLNSCYNEGIPMETLDYFHYNIINKNNEKAIKTSNENNNTANDSYVTVFTSNTSSNQKLKFEASGFTNQYYMVSDEGKYLTSVNSNNTLVTLQNTIISGQENKYRWIVVNSDQSGFFFIKNIGSDRYLKTETNAEDNALIHLATLETEDVFRWKLNLQGTIELKCSISVDELEEEICEKEVNEGVSVKFSVSPNEQGSWSWIGPNNFTATTREISLEDVSSLNSGTYSVTFKTDAHTEIQKELFLNVISYHTPAIKEEGFYRLVNKANNKAIRGYDGNSGSTYFGYADNAGVTSYTDNSVWGSLKYYFLPTDHKNEFYITNIGSGGKYITSIDPTNENKITLQSDFIETEKDNYIWLLLNTSTPGVYYLKNKGRSMYMRSDQQAANSNYIKLVDFEAESTLQWTLIPTVTKLNCNSQITDNDSNNCSLSVSTGDSFTLSPTPDVYTGTWAWSGPNDYSASTRIIHFENFTEDMSGSYEVTYTPSSSKMNPFLKRQNSLTLNFNISKSTLDVNTYNVEKNITIYPNPVDDFLWFDLKKYIGKQANISLYSILGQKISTYTILKIPHTEIKMNLKSKLKKGLYLVKVNIEGERFYQQKLVVN